MTELQRTEAELELITARLQAAREQAQALVVTMRDLRFAAQRVVAALEGITLRDPDA